MKPAVFLDRDGTLMEDLGYLKDPRKVKVYPGVPEALHILKTLGYLTVVISNQSGVARGFMTEREVRMVNDVLLKKIKARGGGLDAVYFCPHHPDQGELPYRQVCRCRKPSPAMVEMAVEEMEIDLEKSFMVGDKPEDIALGVGLGIPVYLVLTGRGKETVGLPISRQATGCFPSLVEVAARLKGIHGSNL